MTKCETKKQLVKQKKKPLVSQSPCLPHPVQLPFIFLFNPCSARELKPKATVIKAGKGIASLVLSSVQSSNFQLFYFSPPRLLFPRLSVIFSVKGGRQESEGESPRAPQEWQCPPPTVPSHGDPKPTLESLWQSQNLGTGAVRETTP